ncbi:1,2-phenylacetyl-CoA epoxidase subunit PaaD [Streptomyces albus]|uniref:1,2-phenylacetyl-CoA epoxidase subunit PaaD n=1 Tax=Streptomyces albus TaxID=1888 RepID=UPI0033DD82AD
MVTDKTARTNGPTQKPRGTATGPAPGEPPGAGSWERLAGAVPDPELPVVTLAELGVLRRVAEPEPGRVLVELTPTYTGCPAVEAMAADIERALTGAGAARVEVRTVLTPPWSTDDISAEGRRKLAEHGVAPPRAGARSRGPVPVALSATRRARGDSEGVGGRPATRRTLPGEEPVRCPRCGSAETHLLSRFSSTACKALRRCENCLEPFDHFKEV